METLLKDESRSYVACRSCQIIDFPYLTEYPQVKEYHAKRPASGPCHQKPPTATIGTALAQRLYKEQHGRLSTAYQAAEAFLKIFDSQHIILCNKKCKGRAFLYRYGHIMAALEFHEHKDKEMENPPNYVAVWDQDVLWDYWGRHQNSFPCPWCAKRIDLGTTDTAGKPVNDRQTILTGHITGFCHWENPLVPPGSPAMGRVKGALSNNLDEFTRALTHFLTQLPTEITAHDPTISKACLAHRSLPSYKEYEMFQQLSGLDIVPYIKPTPFTLKAAKDTRRIYGAIHLLTDLASPITPDDAPAHPLYPNLTGDLFNNTPTQDYTEGIESLTPSQTNSSMAISISQSQIPSSQPILQYPPMTSAALHGDDLWSAAKKPRKAPPTPETAATKTNNRYEALSDLDTDIEEVHIDADSEEEGEDERQRRPKRKRVDKNSPIDRKIAAIEKLDQQTSNRIAALKQLKNTTPQSKKQDPKAAKPSTSTNAQPQPKKAAPIYITGIPNKQQYEHIKTMAQSAGISNLNLQAGRHTTAIKLATLEEQKKMMSTMTHFNVPFFTPSSGDEAPRRFIARGVPTFMDEDDIRHELISRDIPAEKVMRMKSRRADSRGNPLPMVLITVPKGTTLPQLKEKAKALFNILVTWEPYRGSGNPPLCQRCQKPGHHGMGGTCTLPEACRICGGNHPSQQCYDELKQDLEVIKKCINCGEPHQANYKGCKKFQEYKKKIQEGRKKPQQQKKRYVDAQPTGENVWEDRKQRSNNRGNPSLNENNFPPLNPSRQDTARHQPARRPHTRSQGPAIPPLSESLKQLNEQIKNRVPDGPMDGATFIYKYTLMVKSLEGGSLYNMLDAVQQFIEALE